MIQKGSIRRALEGVRPPESIEPTACPVVLTFNGLFQSVFSSNLVTQESTQKPARHKAYQTYISSNQPWHHEAARRSVLQFDWGLLSLALAPPRSHTLPFQTIRCFTSPTYFSPCFLSSPSALQPSRCSSSEKTNS
jgi:hypothetical protein